ncbi:MAG: glycosyltransferase family 39 protein [Candidatus Omnitrophica bacterium]|nr:glycosyltransferase family 39 protein [Candidatus Omnitrophota bacterium]
MNRTGTINLSRGAIRYISYAVLAVIFSWVFITGLQSIRNERRLTFDCSLYDWLGSGLIKNPFNYSAASFWDKIKDRRPEGKEKTIAAYYLSAPLFKHPPVFSYMIAFSKCIFGDTPTASRLVNIFLRALTVLAVYVIAKEAMGPVWALLAALFMAADPVYMFASQKVWIDAPMTFFVYAGLAFLAVSRERTFAVVLAAVCLSLSLLCKYVSAVVVIPAYFAVMMSGIVRDKRQFGIFIAIPVVMFIPWLLWNYAVYGNGFVAKMISFNADTVTGQGPSLGLMTALFAAACVLATLIAAIFFAGESSRRLGKRALKLIEESTSIVGYIKAIPIWTRVLVAVLLFLSRDGLMKAANIRYLPPTSDSMHMFDNEPAYFYFKHLIELSPLYVFSYVSFFAMHKWGKEMRLAGLVAAAALVFFGAFGYYETRYVLPAVPGLLLLAVFSIKTVVDYLRENGKGPERSAAYILFGLIAGFAILKTLYFDVSVVVKNNFIFF